jgi:hypothetical protein
MDGDMRSIEERSLEGGIFWGGSDEMVKGEVKKLLIIKE